MSNGKETDKGSSRRTKQKKMGVTDFANSLRAYLDQVTLEESESDQTLDEIQTVNHILAERRVNFEVRNLIKFSSIVFKHDKQKQSEFLLQYTHDASYRDLLHLLKDIKDQEYDQSLSEFNASMNWKDGINSKYEAILKFINDGREKIHPSKISILTSYAEGDKDILASKYIKKNAQSIKFEDFIQLLKFSEYKYTFISEYLNNKDLTADQVVELISHNDENSYLIAEDYFLKNSYDIEFDEAIKIIEVANKRQGDTEFNNVNFDLPYTYLIKNQKQLNTDELIEIIPHIKNAENIYKATKNLIKNKGEELEIDSFLSLINKTDKKLNEQLYSGKKTSYQQELLDIYFDKNLFNIVLDDALEFAKFSQKTLIKWGEHKKFDFNLKELAKITNSLDSEKTIKYVTSKCLTKNNPELSKEELLSFARAGNQDYLVMALTNSWLSKPSNNLEASELTSILSAIEWDGYKTPIISKWLEKEENNLNKENFTEIISTLQEALEKNALREWSKYSNDKNFSPTIRHLTSKGATKIRSMDERHGTDFFDQLVNCDNPAKIKNLTSFNAAQIRIYDQTLKTNSFEKLLSSDDIEKIRCLTSKQAAEIKKLDYRGNTKFFENLTDTNNTEKVKLLTSSGALKIRELDFKHNTNFFEQLVNTDDVEKIRYLVSSNSVKIRLLDLKDKTSFFEQLVNSDDLERIKIFTSGDALFLRGLDHVARLDKSPKEEQGVYARLFKQNDSEEAKKILQNEILDFANKDPEFAKFKEIVNSIQFAKRADGSDIGIGCEFEMLTEKIVKNYLLPEGYKAVKDGSLVPDEHDNVFTNPIEVVTPIITKDNVLSLYFALSMTKALNHTTNDTCGFHVHVGLKGSKINKNSNKEAKDPSTLEVAKQIVINYLALEGLGFGFPKRNYEMENLSDVIEEVEQNGKSSFVKKVGRSQVLNPLQVKEIEDAKSLKELKETANPFGRSQAKVNLASLFTYGTVEFRESSATISPIEAIATTKFYYDLVQDSIEMVKSEGKAHTPSTAKMELMKRDIKELRKYNNNVIDNAVGKSKEEEQIR